MDAGCRVVRGPDWKWGNQDGGEGHVGTVFFFLINILLFLAKYKHFTAFYTYTNLSDDLQILSTVSYLET